MSRSTIVRDLLNAFRDSNTMSMNIKVQEKNENEEFDGVFRDVQTEFLGKAGFNVC